MTRRVELQNPTTYQSFEDGSSALFLSISRPDVEPVLIELFLLREGLADQFALASRREKLFVARNDALSFGLCEVCDATSFALSLNRRELDLVCDFLLKFYRDGEPEVSQVDIELDSSAGNSVTFVVRAVETRRPLRGLESER